MEDQFENFPHDLGDIKPKVKEKAIEMPGSFPKKISIREKNCFVKQ